MLFTPNYAVSYKGQFYRGGEQFEIAEADAAEMSRHGTIQQAAEPPQKPPAEELPPEELPPDEAEEKMPVLEEPQEIAEPPQEPSRRGRGRRGAEQ